MGVAPQKSPKIFIELFWKCSYCNSKNKIKHIYCCGCGAPYEIKVIKENNN